MSKIVYRLAGFSATSLVACALAVPAHAQLATHKDLTTTIALTMAETAIQTCKAQGYAVSANVVGRSGEIMVAMRGNNTGPHTLEKSMKKAVTARAQRRPSGEFATAVKGN
ncbi:MAG TPA: heme-binding protein, partial [Xanthobacteraceae bacterium]